MKQTLYKNWKKIALALTSIFWASCSDDSSSTAPSPESSASVESSGSVAPISSSEKNESDEKIACTDTTIERTSSSYTYTFPGVKCEDGTLYELQEMCPDYGIPAIPCSKTYIDKDGKQYSESEFKEIYKTVKK